MAKTSSLGGWVIVSSMIFSGVSASATKYEFTLSMQTDLSFDTLVRQPQVMISTQFLKQNKYKAIDLANSPTASAQKPRPPTIKQFQRSCDRSEERRVGKECRSRWSPY